MFSRYFIQTISFGDLTAREHSFVRFLPCRSLKLAIAQDESKDLHEKKMSQTRENPCDLLPSTIAMCLVLDMQLIIQRIAARWVTSFKDPFDEPCLLFFFPCPPTNIFLIVWQNSPRVSHCYMQMISMRVGPKHLHKQKRTCSLKSSAQKNCKLRPQNNHRCKKINKHISILSAQCVVHQRDTGETAAQSKPNKCVTVPREEFLHTHLPVRGDAAKQVVDKLQFLCAASQGTPPSV